MNDVPDVPTDFNIVHINNVSDVQTDFIVENIDYEDNVPDIPICPDDVKGTLPE